MKIRTQLILAFLLLAILPLTGIVLYSYRSSRAAVTRATEAESQALNARMAERLDEIKEDLRSGFQNLRDFPFDTLLGESEEVSVEDRRRLYGRIVREMGEVGTLVDALIFKPLPPLAPRAPEAPEESVLLAPRSFPGLPEIPSGEEGFGLERFWQRDLSLEVDPENEGLIIDYGSILKSLEADEMVLLEEEVVETPVLSGVFVGLEAAVQALEKEMERAEQAGDVERQHEIARSRREIERKIDHLKRDLRNRKLREKRRRRRQEIEAKRREGERLLGHDFGVRIVSKGQTIGQVEANISVEELVRRVLGATPRDRGELPFAVAGDGELYVAEEADREVLLGLRLGRDASTGTVDSAADDPSWVVTSHPDPERALTFGIARPIGDTLAEIDRTAMTNLAAGLGLIGLALLGILPLTRRITRGLETVTVGAERIAQGDLSTRVPISSRNEIGQLAMAFNRMARDLSEHQERLLQEEGRRKEQDLERRLLEAEYARTSRELDDAREFQLSLLPKRVPEHDLFEVAVDMRTATEVGGDYYDFHLDDGVLTIAIGDATGHGAKAGTMVAVIKSLFSAVSSTAVSPSEFLAQAAGAVKRMDLERMAMALAIARLDGRTLTFSSAGMPPILLHRAASGEVEELALAGMPLGGLAFDYQERVVELFPGDTLLLFSDGFPELLNSEGEPLGYARVHESFVAAVGGAPGDVIADLDAAAQFWSGLGTPQDDMTFVVVRIR